MCTICKEALQLEGKTRANQREKQERYTQLHIYLIVGTPETRGICQAPKTTLDVNSIPDEDRLIMPTRTMASVPTTTEPKTWRRLSADYGLVHWGKIIYVVSVPKAPAFQLILKKSFCQQWNSRNTKKQLPAIQEVDVSNCRQNKLVNMSVTSVQLVKVVSNDKHMLYISICLKFNVY